MLKQCKLPAVAVGNFDGVHLGHQHIIDIARQAATAANAPLGVLTFEPHPREYFAPKAPPFRLSGAHKAIRGHFSFFEVDLDHTGSVMNHFLTTGANPLVYVVLCGRMTPKQKEVAKQRALLNMEKLKNLFEWYINESGHQAYEGVTPPTECPKPSFIIDEETPHTVHAQNYAPLRKFSLRPSILKAKSKVH